MNRRPWYACILISGAFLSVSPAEEPVIVHYSDPTLTRLETQLGVTAAQKDRFEDIIVKYRDAARNGAGDAASGQASSPEGTKRGSRHRLQSSSASGSRSVEGQGQKATSRSELDELATVLTPAQLKKFQELNRANRQGRHSGL
jgi:Spy/CpxP family protein refolding chaperone